LKVTGLIAAAGRSSRMGTPKALLQLGGTTFIRHMAQRFLGVGVEQIIVTLPECHYAAQQIREELADLPGVFCRNMFPERELLGSVQTAIGHILASNAHRHCEPKARQSMISKVQNTGLRSVARNDASCLIMPIDVPCPTSEFLKTFLKCTEPTIKIAAHASQPGHPILFTHHFFDEILQLSSSDTLRTVLNRHHDKIVTVESDDSNVIFNINTPADYARFTNPSAKYFAAAAIEAPGVKLR
jgi:molybdenum cofactor cytidylyltransferase